MSQRSVQQRSWGDICNKSLFGNLLIKECPKFVRICPSCDQKSSVVFCQTQFLAVVKWRCSYVIGAAQRNRVGFTLRMRRRQFDRSNIFSCLSLADFARRRSPSPPRACRSRPQPKRAVTLRHAPWLFIAIHSLSAFVRRTHRQAASSDGSARCWEWRGRIRQSWLHGRRVRSFDDDLLRHQIWPMAYFVAPCVDRHAS